MITTCDMSWVASILFSNVLVFFFCVLVCFLRLYFKVPVAVYSEALILPEFLFDNRAAVGS